MRSLRAALLVRDDDPVFPTLERALANSEPRVEIRSLLGRGLPGWKGPGWGTFVRLVESRPDLVWSAHDNLFTSGTLGRYSKILNSVIEKRLSYSADDREEYMTPQQ